LRGLRLDDLLALLAHADDRAAALRERPGEEFALPRLGARDPAPVLVVQVVGAQRVAVHEQRAHALDLVHARVGEELRAGGGAKALADEEVAVAVHEVDRHAAAGEVREQPRDHRVERRLEIVVADPGLEEVAQDVERVGGARLSFEQLDEPLVRCRPLLGEVKVRNEERGHYAGATGGLRGGLLFGADHRRGFDHHGLLRHVAAEGPARAGRRLRDLGHHVHAVDHLAEHRVAPAVLAGIVEEVVVLDVDEELRARRVRVAGARHGDGADVVFQAVLRLVLDGLARRFLAVRLVEAAALDHEAVDHAVEHRAVVVPVLHVLQEVLDRLGRLGRVEFKADRAEVGLDVDLRIGCERAAGHRGEGQDEKMLELHATPLWGVPAWPYQPASVRFGGAAIIGHARNPPFARQGEAGVRSMIRLHDTMTREKREFVPQDPKRITMYVCVPTVYGRANIGNARPAVVFDTLARLIRREFGPHSLKYARNVTDVDDKIIASAQAEGVDPSVITARYERHYLEDMGALGVTPP